MTERKQETASLQIPTDHFIEMYGVENALAKEALHSFPALCYLLGNTSVRKVTDSRDGKVKRKPVLGERNHDGSAMFGLKTPEEAIEWRGIANHIFGSVRNVDFLSQLFAQATDAQKEQMAKLGFDRASMDAVDPTLLQSFQFISHAGRRKADEHAWYGLHRSPEGDLHNYDKPHHSFLYTLEILERAKADPKLIDLLRVENHYFEVDAMRPGINPNVVDSILTYGDWTFNQKPTSLVERFEGLRKSGRQSLEILDLLESAGTNFENALKNVFGLDIFDRMANTPPFPGELEIRTAYAASAGLTLHQIYPDFTHLSRP